MRRILVVGAVVLVALVTACGAAADVGLILRRAAVSAGERMTVWGSCFRMPVYLVRAAYAKQAHYEDYPVVARPPTGREFHLLGRMACTNRMRYVGDYPNGDWSSWNGYLTFRVPHVPPGRYQLVVYCEPCHRGRGGTLIVNNWLWRGSKRVGPTGLTVRG